MKENTTMTELSSQVVIFKYIEVEKKLFKKRKFYFFRYVETLSRGKWIYYEVKESKIQLFY